jgi:hypothetical protein
MLIGSLVGCYLLLRDFEPYVKIFVNVCFVITVAMVTLLRKAHYVHVLTCIIIFLYII